MAIFTNSGIDLLTQYALGLKSALDFQVRLYENNYTPVCLSTTANFTEPNQTGYSQVNLTGDNWTGSTATCLSTYSYPTITWDFASYTSTSNTTIYGYFVVDTNTNITVWADVFSPSYEIPYTGGAINLTITFQSQNC